ncbi:menaquinone-dependent protoporphyrinogen IX dehydrogenase [Maribacter sp. 2307ULW6-5]|uniref:menaquinone-dependent protoporphyrinogen IX dehydrogenase n=1 Tax=Maribacter sp. 2307ULW6-5 TaxID=3386275 RepID=UPI0039BD21B6
MKQQRMAIVYATIDGQTQEISERMAMRLRERGKEVLLSPLDGFKGDMAHLDALIIGASIRYGIHCRKTTEFIRKNKTVLEGMDTAFFSVNLVARKENKNTPETNPYMLKFLKKTNWRPKLMEVFAGKLDYAAYPWFDRFMIKLIMKLTGGPTKTKAPIIYTDWKKVDAFADRMAGQFPTVGR